MKPVDHAVEAVEGWCTPEKMTKPEAVEFLQDVIERLEASIEALNEEMENEMEDDK